jgi:hypothetical protein
MSCGPDPSSPTALAKKEEEEMGERKKEQSIGRREFLAAAALTTPVALLANCGVPSSSGLALELVGFIGKAGRGSGAVPLEGADWYEAADIGDGLEFRVPKGALKETGFLTTDMLIDGNTLVVFDLTFFEDDSKRSFTFRIGGLNQCSLRATMPIQVVNLSVWRLERYAAFLKPAVRGDRIDISKVGKVTLTISRKSPAAARWCMTDLVLAGEEPARITSPVLPKGPLVDELGQSTLHEWPAKTRSEAELKARIQGQLEAAPAQAFPGHFSRWGGSKSRQLTGGSGFFATHHDGKRWWLVDPDGYAFWSQGPNCVRVGETEAKIDGLESALTWLPEANGEFGDAVTTDWDGDRGKVVNYLTANLIRSLGADGWREKWAEIALAELRRLRFNTVANWSDWEWARKARFPYVRPMSFRPRGSKLVYRDFPDVFDPAFEQDAADYAGILEDTAGDPSFLGYFLMNEPSWGFSSELPAEGMLFITAECHAREALASFLRERYVDNSALSAAWKLETGFDRVARGPWAARITPEAKQDLEAFSVIMTERYFTTISDACRRVAPNHLNLGMRWAGLPPRWAVEGMKAFDVFSLNCYQATVPRNVTDEIHAALKMPIMIGEFHFGALDVGLPSSGLGHLRNQTDRAKAYRVYMEDSAANPNCVGAHWFTLYDQSALGRFDGENYNIGFLDVCNRPYEELAAAGIATHERIYEVAAGTQHPYDDVPEYLPRA